MLVRSLRTLCGVLLASLAMTAIAAPADDLAARQKAFQDLLAEHWEYTLSHSPEFASILGDKRWNDKLSDVSEAGILADQAKDRVWLSRLEGIDTTGFPEQEALTKTLLVRSFKESMANEKFKNWEMPVSQMSGIHLNAPQLVPLLSFKTVKDYEDYIARLKQLPKQFDDVTARMRKGMADGLMQPKFLLEKVATQSEASRRRSRKTLLSRGRWRPCRRIFPKPTRRGSARASSPRSVTPSFPRT